jgi:integrase/recombinase XerD
MPIRLATTANKIPLVPNRINASLLSDLYEYMKEVGSSESHMNNTLKTNTMFAHFLGPEKLLFDVIDRAPIISFLDTKIKNTDIDPDKRWITTWNDYLGDIKYFFRWLHNYKLKSDTERESNPSDWETPAFVQIKKKKTKRLSPYLETELWTRDELALIIRYEPFKRNKAVLALMWDLDARNHEVTLLKIKNVRLKERYAEGEIPYQAKTGSGPLLLTFSFPFVRDWLNEHPFRNEPDARLICNLYNGSPIKPEALWLMMKQLRKRIQKLLSTNEIKNEEDKTALEYLLKTKKFNPYCLRHSSITYDSDYLPEYALKKKCRWSMNSRQGNRYIKTRMGNDLKQKILIDNGIIPPDEIKSKPSALNCGRCQLVNAIDNKFCSKCSYPLSPSAYDEIKHQEHEKYSLLQEKYEKDMKEMRNQIENKFTQIISLIQENPKLANVKK